MPLGISIEDFTDPEHPHGSDEDNRRVGEVLPRDANQLIGFSILNGLEPGPVTPDEIRTATKVMCEGEYLDTIW
jgi:hypothetical protein